MRVDVTPFRDASFIRPHKKTFFPIKIPIQHHQLRHYISVAEGGIVYYVSGCDVWALHTKLRRRERIATLGFQPQCLGAGFGWICVGGLNGRCAFIDITDAPPFSSSTNPAPTSGEVDELLPLNLDPQPRDPSENVESTTYAHRPAWVNAKVHVHEMGSEIVNSITMHKMKSQNAELEHEKLAIISSNDRTVQMFSLSQKRVVYTLNFPVQMNHASISPDGGTLVACGDGMSAFFVRRRDIFDRETGPTLFDKYEWAPQFSCQLAATCSPDTCFSTAFSPSGHICTVASQFGTVTVFDMDKVWGAMEDLEAVVDTFTSSRPAAGHDDMRFIDMPGAIRSTAFSPGPWDLFAWAEDQGRICVTDLRDGFRSRQLIELDTKSSDFETAQIVEFEDTEAAELRELEVEAALFRRQRDAADSSDTLASVQSAADYIEHAANRRRRRLHDAAGSDSNPHELTETERQILETLRQERLRESENDPRQSPHAPFSIHYNNGLDHMESSSNSQANSIHQYMRERNLQRASSTRSSRTMPTGGPRRQSSIVISNSNNPTSSTSAPSSQPSSLAPITGTTMSTSPSRLGTQPASHTPFRRSSAAQEATATNPHASLIPTPSASDAWAMSPAPARDSSSASPHPNHSSSPSRTLPHQLISRHSQSSRTTGLPTPSPTISSDHPSSMLPRLRGDETRYQVLHNRERELERRRAQLDAHSSRSQSSTTRTYGHRELEQARAQLAQLTAAVEADTDDVLRQLQQRVSESRIGARGDGASGQQNSIQDGSALQSLNTLNALNAISGGRSLPADHPINTARMDAVRLQNFRRLQDRAVAAASEIGRTESGLGEAYMTSMFGQERDHGAAVMGLGWGDGGRDLYVATEEGIWCFEVKIGERKFWPAVNLK